MLDQVAEFEKAKAEGLHAYEADLIGIGECTGGKATAYVYACNPGEARAKIQDDIDPAEEEVGEVRLQTPKTGGSVDGCPCIVCAAR